MSARGRFGRSTPRSAAAFVFGLVTLFAVISFGTAAENTAADPVIVTESGRLQGIVGSQTIEYLGIPYAAPPVGTFRWMPPRAFGRWKGVFQAAQFGNPCPQINRGDENCLFLNVYTPRGKNRVKPTGRPVMVWIHGGGPD